MTIVVSSSGGDEVIDDYESLIVAVSNWMHRADLVGVIPTFVRLFEARANRALRVRAMEASFDSVELTSGAAALPSDFLGFKSLRYDGSPTYTLQPKPFEWVQNQPDLADNPLYFAVNDAQVVCWPQTGSIVGTYYQKIPSLIDNSTNWLLDDHPDLYLFGCLEEACIYTRNEKLGAVASQRAQMLLDSVSGADVGNSLNGGPLTVRAR